ncbi:hypothetical protein QOZ80_2BG0159920 [Eleusine coracana subsp. coracana]|nr:hypothetical protein QOZ80_2BG0159920 [Eleusine coracana subsp. coracana]
MGRCYMSTELLEREARPFHPKDAKDAFDLLDMCVKALQDARRATREKALAALAGALEELPTLDDLDTRCFNIFALCGVCIKHGSSSLKEVRLAFRAAGLLALTLRGGAPWLLAQSFPALARTIQGQDHDAMSLVAAIDCLAVVTFAGARGKEDVAGATKTSTLVLVAAVSTWAFLLTTIVSVTDAHRKADGAVWNATVASLAGLLDHDDRAVRMAAGEALAVCVELNLTQHTPRKDMNALQGKVSELASETPGRGVNNAILPEQKNLFRQIAAFLGHGERPEKSLPTSMERCVALKVSTWAKLVQLNFLRRFLGSGFEKHVEGNELFKEAFSYGADEGKVLSIVKKQQSSKTKETDYLKVRRGRPWDWSIFCDYPYKARRKPETLLQIGWQALN